MASLFFSNCILMEFSLWRGNLKRWVLCQTKHKQSQLQQQELQQSYHSLLHRNCYQLHRQPLFTRVLFHPNKVPSVEANSWNVKHSLRLDLNHRRRKRLASPVCVIRLTVENGEKVLDEGKAEPNGRWRETWLYDEIDGVVVVLKLQGACGSCPSSTMTLKMGIETRLGDKIPEIMEVEQILDTETGLELNDENVEKVLSEIRPYLAGTGGGALELVQIKGFLVQV